MHLAFNSAFVNRKYSFNVSLMNLYEQNNIVTLQDFFHAWNTFSVEEKRTLSMTEIYESMPVSWQNQISVPDCDFAWVVLPSVSLKFIRFTLVNMQIEHRFDSGINGKLICFLLMLGHNGNELLIFRPSSCK